MLSIVLPKCSMNMYVVCTLYVKKIVVENRITSFPIWTDVSVRSLKYKKCTHCENGCIFCVSQIDLSFVSNSHNLLCWKVYQHRDDTVGRIGLLRQYLRIIFSLSASVVVGETKNSPSNRETWMLLSSAFGFKS